MLPFASIQKTGVKFFAFAALLLIATAVLTLIYPMILAVIFAVLCVMGAMACLKLAWKIHRAGRSMNQAAPHVHVHIETPYEHESIQ